MSQSAQTFRMGQTDWQELLDAAIFETERENLTRRIQEARDAIMDAIEDSFQTATSTERQALISAMNAVHELETASGKPNFRPSRAA